MALLGVVASVAVSVTLGAVALTGLLAPILALGGGLVYWLIVYFTQVHIKRATGFPAVEGIPNSEWTNENSKQGRLAC